MTKLPSESSKDVVCCFFCHMQFTEILCYWTFVDLIHEFSSSSFFVTVILLNSIVWR